MEQRKSKFEVQLYTDNYIIAKTYKLLLKLEMEEEIK